MIQGKKSGNPRLKSGPRSPYFSGQLASHLRRKTVSHGSTAGVDPQDRADGRAKSKTHARHFGRGKDTGKEEMGKLTGPRKSRVHRQEPDRESRS